MTDITDEDRRALSQDILLSIPAYLHKSIFKAFASVRLAAESRGAERERALKAERDELWDALFDAIAMMGHCMNLTSTAIIGGEVLKAKDVWQRGHDLLLGKRPARHADQQEAERDAAHEVIAEQLEIRKRLEAENEAMREAMVEALGLIDLECFLTARDKIAPFTQPERKAEG